MRGEDALPTGTHYLPPALPGPGVEPGRWPSWPLRLAPPPRQALPGRAALFLGRPGSGSGAPRGWGGEQERKKRKEREIKQSNTLPSKCGFILNFQNT